MYENLVKIFRQRNSSDLKVLNKDALIDLRMFISKSDDFF